MDGKEDLSRWRQIGATLVAEIDSGVFAPGERLPASADLAARFGVNRHTVLRAISHLQDEGVVRVERGRRGTYVVENVLRYRMGARTRFEENLAALNRVPWRRLVALREHPAPDVVAAALEIAPAAPVTLAALLGEADGIPISYGYNYFPSARFVGILEAFRALGEGPPERLSITAALALVGVNAFRRLDIRLRSRMPTADEARRLSMPVSESVMEIEVTNVDNLSRPVMYALTCFAASRVEFVLEP